jgi:2-polyprenyl-6-methoxyphenol hydroxylase-like FAD-dependent oxidoreductase
VQSHSSLGEARSIVTVGLGPVGLASVIEAVRHDSKKRKVIAFTNRSEYTRRQVLKIDLDDLHYLEKLVGKEKIDELYQQKKIIPDFDRMRGHDVVSFQAKEIEKLLFAKVKEYADKGMVELIDIGTGGQESIKSIDQHAHQLVLKSGRKISFDLIVEADGAKHELANVLQKMQAAPIEFYPAQHPQFHKLHTVINFKLPRGTDMADKYRANLPGGEEVIAIDRVPTKVDRHVMARLKQLGWTHHSMPEIRIFSNRDTLYVGCECSNKMSATPESREEWVRAVLRSYLSVADIKALSVHKDKRSMPENYLLNIELDEASQPVYKLPKRLSDSLEHLRSAYLILVGDALRKTHYHTGSGALTGLREANAFGIFLRTAQNKVDMEHFISAVNELRDANRQRVNDYFRMREMREQQNMPQPGLQSAQPRQRHHASRSTKNAQPNLQKTVMKTAQEELDDAYRALHIERNPLYVCDAKDVLTRFERQYAGNIATGLIANTDHQEFLAAMIRADLESRVLKVKTTYLSDFTTSMCQSETTLHGSKNSIKLAFVTDDRDGKSGLSSVKTYHFHLFDVHDSGKLFNLKSWKISITADGKCRLIIAADAGDLYMHIRAKFGWVMNNLSRDIGGEASSLSNHYSSTGEADFNSLRDYNLIRRIIHPNNQWDNFEMDDRQLAQVCSLIHYFFCSNPSLSVYDLLAVMKAKIEKRKSRSEQQKWQGLFGFFANINRVIADARDELFDTVDVKRSHT